MAKKWVSERQKGDGAATVLQAYRDDLDNTSAVYASRSLVGMRLCGSQCSVVRVDTGREQSPELPRCQVPTGRGSGATVSLNLAALLAAASSVKMQT